MNVCPCKSVIFHPKEFLHTPHLDIVSYNNAYSRHLNTSPLYKESDTFYQLNRIDGLFNVATNPFLTPIL